MAWQLGLIALGPVGWLAAGVATAAAAYGAYKACSDSNDNTSSSTSRELKRMFLFDGKAGAGKSTVLNWINNNAFKEGAYEASIKHKKIENDNVTYYDTAGHLRDDTEELKRELKYMLWKKLTFIYIFDVSKYDRNESSKWVQMLKN